MRSEQEKWRVPDVDPAGLVPEPNRGTGSMQLPEGGTASQPVQSAERARLIYCGQCGALNPATNSFCVACGATLVDAFHASEGLRVYDRADTASRLIDIIPPGSELDLVNDPDAGPDYMRVKLEYGRLGYIRVSDIEGLANMAPSRPIDPLGTPDINTNARGCISQTGALGAILLMVMLTILTIFYINTAAAAEQGIIALAACVSLGPLLVLTVAMYIYARARDERLESEADELVEEAAQRANAEGGE